MPKRMRKVTDEDLLMTGQEDSLKPAEDQTSLVADSGENGVPPSERAPLLFSMENILAASEEATSDLGHASAVILSNPEAHPAQTMAPPSPSPQQLVAQQTGSISVEPLPAETAPEPVEKESTLPLPSTILREYYERLSYVLPIYLSSGVPSTSPSTSSSSEASGPTEAIDLTVGNHSISEEIPQEMPVSFGTLNPPLAFSSIQSPWMVPGINYFAPRILPPLGTLAPIAPPANPVAHHPLPTNFFRDMLKRMQPNSRQDEIDAEPPRKKQKVDDVVNAEKIPLVQTPDLNGSVQEIFNMNLQSIKRKSISNETLEDVMQCISLGDTQEVNQQLNLITQSIFNTDLEENKDTNAAEHGFDMGEVKEGMSGAGSTGIEDEGIDLDIGKEQSNYLNTLDFPKSRSVSVEKNTFQREGSEELKRYYGPIENISEASTFSNLEAANVLLSLSESTKDITKKPTKVARKAGSKRRRNTRSRK